MHEVTYRQPFVVVNELLQTYAEILRFKRACCDVTEEELDFNVLSHHVNSQSGSF